MFWAWFGFNAGVVGLLLLDLLVLNRRAHEIRFREALVWVALWVGLALAFNLGVWQFLGGREALRFFTAYVVEEALSVDNLFVFLVLFGYFGVPAACQHRVLFWGIVGAMLMRASFLFAGTALIRQFHWVLYLFGAFLVFTGLKLAVSRGGEVRPERNPLVRLARRLFPVTPEFAGSRFFVLREGRRLATPLLLALVAVETTDVVFAVDSVPAVLAIVPDNLFIAYTSNVCAILGLRALFFVLAGLMRHFRFLRYGLALILAFIGVKMLLSAKHEIPIAVALGVVGAILLAAILASVLVRPKPAAETPAPAPAPPAGPPASGEPLPPKAVDADDGSR